LEDEVDAVSAGRNLAVRAPRAEAEGRARQMIPSAPPASIRRESRRRCHQPVDTVEADIRHLDGMTIRSQLIDEALGDA
jgi:hypothetical protein